MFSNVSILDLLLSYGTVVQEIQTIHTIKPSSFYLRSKPAWQIGDPVKIVLSLHLRMFGISFVDPDPGSGFGSVISDESGSESSLFIKYSKKLF